MKKRSTYRTSIPALILLCIYLLNPVKLYLPYLDYQVNYDYIVKFLCENKDKPKLHCNGKCYLSKALKSQEKNNTPSKINIKNFNADELPSGVILLTRKTEIFQRQLSALIFSLDTFSLESLSPPPKFYLS